jgi:GntR family transcriptional regulator, sialic acid-inducible nan operon repressor
LKKTKQLGDVLLDEGLITQEQLGTALAENRDAVHEPERFERTDVAFHYVLALIPANPVFIAIHEGIVGWLREQRSTSMRAEGAIEAAYRAHERIFEAVRARDPDRAEAAMRDHLDEVARFYWRVKGRSS